MFFDTLAPLLRWPRHAQRRWALGRLRTTWVVLLVLCLALPWAQAHEEVALKAGNTRAAPLAGPMLLDVDLTDTERKIIEVRQTLPVRPGPLTLYYPRWLPGTHAPEGPLSQLAGLHMEAQGKPLAWQRDSTDMYAFHLNVPQGVQQLQLRFQFLSPLSSNTGRVIMTPEIVGLQWNAVLLYPSGHAASALTVRPRVRLPADWTWASSLDARSSGAAGGASTSGSQAASGRWQAFEDVSLETLVDSPLWAGRHTQRLRLDSQDSAPVYLNLFADTADELKASEEQIRAHRQLVTQADRLFGARHFKRYEFLLAISEHFSGIGLEHAQSSENGVRLGYFSDWSRGAAVRTLLPHEYTHSWNGKFRRPQDLTTAHYNEAMRDSLLWVYEGQTQYWGWVLSARSGLLSAEQARDNLAHAAAALDARAGRTWRSLQDTTNEPIISYRSSKDWRSWQRAADYYDEGTLIWLEVDSWIREKSGDQKSLNDVARQFFGVEPGRLATLTYTFDDVVAALNQTAPRDWAAFLRQRLDSLHAQAPLEGLARSGWRLAYSDKPSDYGKHLEALRKVTSFAYSLGLELDKDGKLVQVLWGSPAFKAGLAPQSQIVAVNSWAYSSDRLSKAITQAQGGTAIELLVKSADRYRTVKLDYRGGLRYPKLERMEGQPDRLSAILSAMP